MVLLKTDKILCLITLLLLLIFYLFNLNQYIDTFFILTLVTIGVSHGAIDHIIFLKGEGNKELSLKKFHASYILTMIGIGISWFLFPTISLILFLIISTYHFGESQLFHLKINKWFRYSLYIIWGSFILSTFISYGMYMGLDLIIGTVLLVIFLLLYYIKKISLNRLIIELLLIFMMLFSAYVLTPLLTFTIYFGIWHSLRTLIIEYKSLEFNSVKKFIKSLLPYTLLTLIIGLSIIIGFNYFDIDFSSDLLLFAIISMITIPHAVVMHGLYSNYNEEN